MPPAKLTIWCVNFAEKLSGANSPDQINCGATLPIVYEILAAKPRHF